MQFANTLQTRGLPKTAALREAALTRLRPVLMTSAATVFGHFPLVFVSGPGPRPATASASCWSPGMTIGTLFTLFVVPVFYSLIAEQHQPRQVADEADEETFLVAEGAKG